MLLSRPREGAARLGGDLEPGGPRRVGQALPRPVSLPCRADVCLCLPASLTVLWLSCRYNDMKGLTFGDPHIMMEMEGILETEEAKDAAAADEA